MTVSSLLFTGCADATPEDVQIALPPTWSDPCGQEMMQEVSWERAAELSELKVPLDQLEGRCEGKLLWNASMGDDDPALAHTTTMRVEVVFDHGSARLSQRERRDRLSSCADKVTVDAHVKLSSEDAAFAAEADTVLALSGVGARSLVFAVPAAELKGTFGSTEALGDGSVVIFRSDGAASNCAGDISVVTPESKASRAADAPELAVGSWSAGGCARNELPRDVHERVGGRTLLEQAHAAWDSVSLDGRWDDGGTGALRVELTSVEQVACWQPERQVFVLPARVRLSTDDGRIGEHEAAATIDVPDPDIEDLTYVELHVDETMLCSGSERAAAAWPDCQSDIGLSVSLSLVKDLADAEAGTMGALLVATHPDATPVKLIVSSSAGSQRQ